MSAHEQIIRAGGKDVGRVWRGCDGRWQASAPSLGERTYLSLEAAKTAVLLAVKAAPKRARSKPAPAPLLPLDLADQGRRKLHGDVLNHHVVAASGRKDGAVTRTRDGRTLAWGRDALIGERQPEEADAVVRKTVR